MLPDVHVGDLRGWWELQRRQDDCGYFCWLEELLRRVLAMLALMDSPLHLARGPTQIDAQHADSALVHFLAQSIRDRAERVLRGGVLRRARPGMNSCVGIDEDNLPAALDELR